MKRTTQLMGAVSATALIALSAPAMAEGTNAGDTITNNVTVGYSVGTVEQTDATASDSFTVDRKVNVLVDFTGTSNTSVSPGEENVVLAFDVTNLTNATVDLDLTAALESGTAANIDGFSIYLDTDGDGELDADELAAGPITYLDEVAEDDVIEVLVVADIELAAVDGNTFDVSLTADAHEAGVASTLGAEISATTGANTAGVDTVLADGSGTVDNDNEGDYSDNGTYEVAAAALTVSKSSSIISDPVNGTTNPKAIPGAVIEYCITVANGSGAATATDIDVNDVLPGEVTFDATFGIFVDGDASCANGTDGTTVLPTPTASYNSTDGEVDGVLSDIAATETRSLYFRVTID